MKKTGYILFIAGSALIFVGAGLSLLEISGGPASALVGAGLSSLALVVFTN